MKLVVHVDGGARGNPGPAAVGVVVSTPDGAVLYEIGEVIGVATTNGAADRVVRLARVHGRGDTSKRVASSPMPGPTSTTEKLSATSNPTPLLGPIPTCAPGPPRPPVDLFFFLMFRPPPNSTLFPPPPLFR